MPPVSQANKQGISLNVFDCTFQSHRLLSVFQPFIGQFKMLQVSQSRFRAFEKLPFLFLHLRCRLIFPGFFRKIAHPPNPLSFYLTGERVALGCLLSILSESYPLHIERSGLLKHHFQRQWMKHSSMRPRQGLS